MKSSSESRSSFIYESSNNFICFSRCTYLCSAYESYGLAVRFNFVLISLYEDFVEDLLESESDWESSLSFPERPFSLSFNFCGFAGGCSPQV